MIKSLADHELNLVYGSLSDGKKDAATVCFGLGVITTIVGGIILAVGSSGQDFYEPYTCGKTECSCLRDDQKTNPNCSAIINECLCYVPSPPTLA